MGLLFIVTGDKAKDREKTLDHHHTVEGISPYLSPCLCANLYHLYPSGDGVYAWGATIASALDPLRAKMGEYVVEMQNTTAVRVFRFGFCVDTGSSGKIQKYFGWESAEGNKNQAYRWVFFLKEPVAATITDKAFYEYAFAQGDKKWLTRHRYFDDKAVHEALDRVGCESLEQLLGLEPEPLVLNQTSAAGTVVAPARRAGLVAGTESFGREVIKAVWEKASVVLGMKTLRLDYFGSLIRESQFEQQTAYGWNVALLNPQRSDMSDPSNLIALHWRNQNRLN